MPDVDVVILTWNRTAMTVDAVRSALGQAGVTPHVWLVDQGSAPSELSPLRELAAAHDNVHLVEVGRNLGVPGGRNLGMSLGSAAYVVSLDNDAVFESPDALRRVAERFAVDPSIGAIGFRVRNFYTGGDDELSWVYPGTLRGARDREFVATRFAGGAHAVRRQVISHTGGYDERLFFYWEEVDFSYKMIRLGFRILYCPAVVVLHKVSPEARVSWEGERFYYLVRNALYLRCVHFGASPFALMLGAGYVIKGVFNGVSRQALRGLAAALPMYLRSRAAHGPHGPRLGTAARAYILEHETRHRGGILERLRREVFVGLPGRRRA